MEELLTENMVEARQRGLEGGEMPPGTGSRNRKPVATLGDWIQAFSLYAGVVVTHFPEQSVGLLAYQATIFAEAARCGGRGWSEYDAAFRSQAAAKEEPGKVDWGSLRQGIYASTFLNAKGDRIPCSRCYACAGCTEPSHLGERCPRPRARPPQRGAEPRGERRWRPQEPRRERGPPPPRACYAWNDGTCTTPKCRYDHVCAGCGGPHKREACRPRGEERREERGRGH